MSSSTSPRRTDFGPLAARYDELRGVGELWQETVAVLVREGALRGRRVLDVGCGTGKLAAALAERYGCRVSGVDVSPEMLAVARGRVPPGVELQLAAAEALPFEDASFERVVLTLVVHHLDRPRACPEFRRVLGEDGRLAFLTFDPAQFGGYYLNEYFPSFRQIDGERFAPPHVLEAELRRAGFAGVTVVSHRQRVAIDRQTALTKIRGRHISTFQLISDEEYEAGLARAERELPARVEYEYYWLVVTARA
ncbi:MAG: class I SAM-dependent methyltransferase [Gaiellaceae bacterium]